jgi:hypothetical protein
MQGYTVVGYYEDNGNIWVEHVNGHDTNEAVVKAVKKMEKSHNPDYPPAFKKAKKDFSKGFRQNMCIVEVFCGTHRGQTDGVSVSSAINWPGLEID